MPSCESNAGTGLEVPLELRCSTIIFESNASNDLPRPMLGGMRRPAQVVLCQALTNVGGHADIALLRVAHTLKQVNVPQRCPPSLKLRSAPSFALSNVAGSCRHRAACHP